MGAAAEEGEGEEVGSLCSGGHNMGGGGCLREEGMVVGGVVSAVGGRRGGSRTRRDRVCAGAAGPGGRTLAGASKETDHAPSAGVFIAERRGRGRRRGYALRRAGRRDVVERVGMCDGRAEPCRRCSGRGGGGD